MDQTLLDKYGKQYGTRFTKKQKRNAINALEEDYKALGYEITQIKGKKLLARTNSYFFGSMKNMKTCIVIPYDTPERRFWYKNHYYPFDGTKTLNKNVMATFGPLILLYAVIFGVLYLGKPLIATPAAASAVSAVMFLMILLLIYMMMHGIRNTHNAARYSAAVAMALGIAKRLDKDEKKRVAFLFTDGNKSSFIGAKSSMEEFQNAHKSPNMICLDTIGKGAKTMVGYVGANRKLANEIVGSITDKKGRYDTMKIDEQMRMQTPYCHFTKAVVVASGDVDDHGRLLIMGTQTGKDTEVEMNTIQKAEDMIYSYVHNLK